MSEKLRKLEQFYPLAYLGLWAVTLTTAFSRSVRQEILQRDGFACVKTGRTDNLEAAHITHNKQNPNYNNPSNGRILTSREHYLEHYHRHGQKSLGLSKKNNLWAVRIIYSRLSDEDKIGLPHPDILQAPERKGGKRK